MRASVTLIKTKIPGWEQKDRQSIVRTLKGLQELNEEFKGYHYFIVELMGNTEVLAEEQKVLDDHENKADDLIERLEYLVATTEPVMPHASGKDG